MNIDNFLNESHEAIKAVDYETVKTAVEILKNAYKNNKIVIIAGNGGSAFTSSHFALDINCRCNVFARDNMIFRVISLTDNVGMITATANDHAYDKTFEILLKQYASKENIFIAISASGDSLNILKAAELAKVNDMKIISLTGNNGGKLRNLTDVHINVPCDNMSIIESVHLLLVHMITELLIEQLRCDNSRP